MISSQLHKADSNRWQGSMATFWVGGDGGKSEHNKQGQLECASRSSAEAIRSSAASSFLSECDGLSGEERKAGWTTTAVLCTTSDMRVLIDDVQSQQ